MELTDDIYKIAREFVAEAAGEGAKHDEAIEIAALRAANIGAGHLGEQEDWSLDETAAAIKQLREALTNRLRNDSTILTSENLWAFLGRLSSHPKDKGKNAEDMSDESRATLEHWIRNW